MKIMWNKVLTILYWLVLLFYVYLVIDTVFLSRESMRSVNLIPFRTIMGNVMVDDGIRTKVVDMAVWANVLMFIPAGIYTMQISKNTSIVVNLFKVTTISILIELIQYVFAIGAADIDDVILNSLGGLIGIAFYSILLALTKTKENTKQVISILSVVVGIPVFVLYIMLILLN